MINATLRYGFAADYYETRLTCVTTFLGRVLIAIRLRLLVNKLNIIIYFQIQLMAAALKINNSHWQITDDKEQFFIQLWQLIMLRLRLIRWCSMDTQFRLLQFFIYYIGIISQVARPKRSITSLFVLFELPLIRICSREYHKNNKFQLSFHL